MNTKHTQGPWGYRRAFSNGEPCGMVITPMGYDLNTSNKEENEANARLIAAAPELLAALQLAVKLIPVARRHFPKSVRNGDKFDLENACATITAAIAKTKGEA